MFVVGQWLPGDVVKDANIEAMFGFCVKSQIRWHFRILNRYEV